MKVKKIAILVTIVFSLKSLSQTNKGNFYIGAESSSFFSSSSEFLKLPESDEKLNESNSTNFNISPNIGYFIIDGLMIGAKIDFTYIRDKTNFIESTTNSILAGPTVRYYFLKNKIRPFITGTYTYSFFKIGSTNLVEDGDIDDFKQRIQNLDLGIGTSFFFSKNISLDIVLSYSKIFSENLSRSNSTEFSRTNNQFISSFGFSIFL